MSEEDAARWDSRWSDAPAATPALPAIFAGTRTDIPTSGNALELACGAGATSVWLAQRGLDVVGVDVSPVAVQSANDLAANHGVEDCVDFAVHDLDHGLPPGPPMDVIVCHLFRDARLDGEIIDRLAPGGVLMIAVLSEVDAEPGPFRAARGELDRAFDRLEVLDRGEGNGVAFLSARRPGER